MRGVSGAGNGGGSSTGNSGVGGAPTRCLWGGNGGGLTFPVCPAQFTSEFMGTIDGTPFDTKDSGHITGVSLPIAPPYQLNLGLSGGGRLDMEWGDPYIIGQWTKISGGGTMLLPGESTTRIVSMDSEILSACGEFAFLYILHITGGELTGCSR